MKVKLKKVTDYYGDNDFETTRLGFVHYDFFVTNPMVSECGRFDVNPMEYYGLTQHQMYELDKFNQADPDYMNATSQEVIIMKYVLSDIKRGYKIKTVMKKHDISATLVLACMRILERS